MTFTLYKHSRHERRIWVGDTAWLRRCKTACTSTKTWRLHVKETAWKGLLPSYICRNIDTFLPHPPAPQLTRFCRICVGLFCLHIVAYPTAKLDEVSENTCNIRTELANEKQTELKCMHIGRSSKSHFLDWNAKLKAKQKTTELPEHSQPVLASLLPSCRRTCIRPSLRSPHPHPA